MSNPNDILAEICAKLAHPTEGVTIKDRRYRLKTYKSCFVGSEAAQWFIQNVEHVKTKEEAVQLGQNLIDNGFVCHVVSPKKPFQDDYLFYRVTNIPSSPKEIKQKEQTDVEFSVLVADGEYVKTLTNTFRNTVECKDRKKKVKVHRYCFIGSEAVNCVASIIQSTKGITPPRSLCVEILQMLMDLGLFVQVTKKNQHAFRDSNTVFFRFVDNREFQLRYTIENLHLKRVGQVKAKEGFAPKYPVILVPGIISCGLNVWSSEIHPEWNGERIWLDIGKIGLKHNAKSVKGDSTKDFSQSPEEELERRNALRLFSSHLLPMEDGFSDPPGVKVRAREGLNGLDFMADGILRKSSYIFGHVIRNLIDVGYDPVNLKGAPYDWRLNPDKLEERDHYFSSLKDLVEQTYKFNNNCKVVLVGHSMGNRTVSYFLNWVNDKQWIDKHVHAWMALGAPWLGAGEGFRGLLTGDTLGLNFFFKSHEGLQIARYVSSLPWLMPVKEEIYPDAVVRVRRDKEKNWEQSDCVKVIEEHAPRAFGFWTKYFAKNPYIMGDKAGSEIPALHIPVKNLWCISGINVDTQAGYFFKVAHQPNGQEELVLDPDADQLSYHVDSKYNPRGMKIKKGIMYENCGTYQENYKCYGCGDGTVPYASLAYGKKLKEKADEERKRNPDAPNVEYMEVEGAQHREMLNNNVVLEKIIEYVCEKKN